MSTKGIDRAAAALAKQGPSSVETAIGSLAAFLKEVKREFHRDHPDLVLKNRDLIREQEALQELLIALHTPMVKAIRKHWRHCGLPVNAKSVIHALTGEVGILVECRYCKNKRSLYGR